MDLISPSQLVLQATGLQPEGSSTFSEAHDEKACAVCGAAFALGDTIDKMKLPPTFTNHTSLAHPAGQWRCGACTAVMTRSVFQMGASTVLVCAEGVFPIMRKEHRAWAILTPPEPPFLIAVQNAKSQHVVWRAPVTLSKDLILARIGDAVVKIRRPLLLKAKEEARLLQGLKQERGRPTKDSIENPFFSDWKFQSPIGGQLKPYVNKLLSEKAVTPEQISTLLSLNAGEVWALGASLYEQPIKPEPINIPN